MSIGPIKYIFKNLYIKKMDLPDKIICFMLLSLNKILMVIIHIHGYNQTTTKMPQVKMSSGTQIVRSGKQIG